MALLFKDLFAGSKPVNGELTINLNLTIKIEADGSLSVSPTVAAQPRQQQVMVEVAKPEEEKIDYAIPVIDVNEDDLIKFGKNV